MNKHYEYYFEKGSKIVVLSHKGTEMLRDQLELHKHRCKICNNLLILITKKEGSFIVCSGDAFNHMCGYDIDMSDFKKEPLIRNLKEEEKMCDKYDDLVKEATVKKDLLKITIIFV